MSLLPADPERFATKDDLAVMTATLRTEMTDLRTELRTDMADLRTELRTGLADLRTELHTAIGDVRTELHTEIAGVRTEVANLRGDMLEKMSDQTRTIVIAIVGMCFTFAGLVAGLRIA